MNFNPIKCLDVLIMASSWRSTILCTCIKIHEITWYNINRNPNLWHVQVEDHGNCQQNAQNLLIASSIDNLLVISCFDYK